jgi:hypothetical protein
MVYPGELLLGKLLVQCLAEPQGDTGKMKVVSTPALEFIKTTTRRPPAKMQTFKQRCSYQCFCSGLGISVLPGSTQRVLEPLRGQDCTSQGKCTPYQTPPWVRIIAEWGAVTASCQVNHVQYLHRPMCPSIRIDRKGLGQQGVCSLSPQVCGWGSTCGVQWASLKNLI